MSKSLLCSEPLMTFTLPTEQNPDSQSKSKLSNCIFTTCLHKPSKLASSFVLISFLSSLYPNALCSRKYELFLLSPSAFKIYHQSLFLQEPELNNDFTLQNSKKLYNAHKLIYGDHERFKSSSRIKETLRYSYRLSIKIIIIFKQEYSSSSMYQKTVRKSKSKGIISPSKMKRKKGL